MTTAARQVGRRLGHFRARPADAGALWAGRIGVAVLLLLVWQLALTHLSNVPSPLQVARAMADASLLGESGHTVVAAVVGWVIAVGLGVPLALIIGEISVLGDYTIASVEIVRVLPSIVVVPIAIVLEGFSTSAEILVVVMGAGWPTISATIDAVRRIPPGTREIVQACGLSFTRSLLKITLPYAVPVIRVGARLSIGLALALTVVCEMVGNPQGLGAAIVQDQQALNPPAMFAAILCVGIIGVALNAIVVGLFRLLPGAGPRSVREAEL